MANPEDEITVPGEGGLEDATFPRIVAGIVWEDKPHLLDGNYMIGSGVAKFSEGDWPGVFLRGSHALEFAAALRRVLAYGLDPYKPRDTAALRELAELLGSCHADYHRGIQRPTDNPPKLRRVK